MIVQGALSTGESPELVKSILIQYRNSYESLLAERFEKAKVAGDLPNDGDHKELAKYLATLHQGMSVQATSGATKHELINTVNLALKVWSN